MKKRYRFLIILVVLAVGLYFLWPTIKWYFLTPQADKDMAESSRNQIKVYAQQRADDAIQRLLSLGEQTALPTRVLVPRSRRPSCAIAPPRRPLPRRGPCGMCLPRTRAAETSRLTSRTGTAARCSP